MATITDILNTSARRLKERDIESAHLDAQLLLAKSMGLSREELLANGNEVISQKQVDNLEDLLRRRLEGECVSYICKRAYFYGHELYIEPGVLVPRPETELLVKCALEWVDARDRNSTASIGTTVADIGTGSGCIAISLAIARPGLKIYATDISGIALEVAKKNIEKYKLEKQITLLVGNLCESLPEKVDLIVANLPYLPDYDRSIVAVEVTREPARALFAGKDGLDVIKRLLTDCLDKLNTGGAIILEFDPRQRDAIEAILSKSSKFDAIFCQDCSKKDRVVVLKATGAISR